MRVMLLRETNGLPELTDGLTALTAWVMRQTEGDGELRRRCLTVLKRLAKVRALFAENKVFCTCRKLRFCTYSNYGLSKSTFRGRWPSFISDRDDVKP